MTATHHMIIVSIPVLFQYLSFSTNTQRILFWYLTYFIYEYKNPFSKYIYIYKQTGNLRLILLLHKIKHTILSSARAEKLIEITAMFNILIKVKKKVWQNSIIMKYCSAAETPWPINLFSRCEKTCLFGTNHNKCHIMMLTFFSVKIIIRMLKWSFPPILHQIAIIIYLLFFHHIMQP